MSDKKVHSLHNKTCLIRKRCGLSNRWVSCAVCLNIRAGLCLCLHDMFFVQAAAHAHERLGDVLIASSSRRSLVQAQDTYRQAVQILGIVNGPATPFSKVAIQKLVRLQARLPYSDVKLTQSCNFCGKPDRKTAPLKLCARCQSASFCCREHQAAQWKIHKTHCVPVAAEKSSKSAETATKAGE